MAYHLNVLIDPELERALRMHVEESQLDNQSAAVRDLLRHALGVVASQREAGWHEGYNAAVAAVAKTIRTSLSEIRLPPAME